MAARYATSTFAIQLALIPSASLAVAAVGTGGTFAAATYFWKITFTNANGETGGSNEATATIVLNGSCNLTWSAPPSGTSNVKVYRGTATGAENALITTLAGSAIAYTDTGTAGSVASPPAVNSAFTAADHLVIEGALRDSAHPAVVLNPNAFSTSPSVAGVGHVDGKLFARLAAYPAGTEL